MHPQGSILTVKKVRFFCNLSLKIVSFTAFITEFTIYKSCVPFYTNVKIVKYLNKIGTLFPIFRKVESYTTMKSTHTLLKNKQA